MSESTSTVARALVGSPLRKPLGGCLFVAAMLPLLALAFLGHFTLWIEAPLGALSVAISAAAIGTIASLPVIWLLWYLDRRERESPWFFAGALLWGAVISTGVSAIFNALGFGFIAVGLEIAGGLDSEVLGELLTAALVAPPVEEAAKGIALLVLFWFLRAEFDNLRDGVIYGALIGLGFNIAEYALYVMNGYLEADGAFAPYATQFATRFVFLGLNGHALWTALCGAGIGIARQTSRGCLKLIAPVGGYTLAVIGHAANNSIGIFGLVLALAILGVDFETVSFADISPITMWIAAASMNILLQGLNYLIFGAALYQSAQWEREVIRTQLADEPASVVTPAEYQAVVADRLFQTRRLPKRSDRHAAAIVNAQNELAFRKWHVVRDGGDPATDSLVRAWREDIVRLRTEE
ncbi:MAG TPA: PrsW family intramembrane metalloprotease [Roseiflexaceae bacterium]|nr:PrsW family intramembrane metalloprotease [Roseiflexaceae bacterium]